jgi:hypothetical protein
MVSKKPRMKVKLARKSGNVSNQTWGGSEFVAMELESLETDPRDTTPWAAFL